MKRLSPLVLAWITLAVTFLQLTLHLMKEIHDIHIKTSSFPGGQRQQQTRELRNSVGTASSEWRLRSQSPLSLESSLIIKQKRQRFQPSNSSSLSSSNFYKSAPAFEQQLLSQNRTRQAIPPSVQPMATHFSNHFVLQPIQNLENENNPTPNTSAIYWDLSCPLEMTMFAGSHMGGDFLHRARQARTFVEMERVLERMLQEDWPHMEQQHHQRRVFLVGDSLMRQVFISWACLLWQHMESFAIPWFDEDRLVRARLPNTVWRGAHSKFEEGRVRFRNNTLELIYHHGMGGVLVLGEDYHEHDDGNLWIESCYKRQPFSTNVVDIPDHVRGEHIVTEASVVRKRMVMQPNDVVLMNGSVHRERQFSLQNMVDLMDCMNHPNLQPQQLSKTPAISIWPTFAYVMTGSEHFPTETGAFEARLLHEEQNYPCRQESIRHDRQDEEWAMFSNRIPVLGRRAVQLESKLGHLHVGGRDCLHWLQPGLPDLIAADASHFVASLEKSTLISNSSVARSA